MTNPIELEINESDTLIEIGKKSSSKKIGIVKLNNQSKIIWALLIPLFSSKDLNAFHESARNKFYYDINIKKGSQAQELSFKNLENCGERYGNDPVLLKELNDDNQQYFFIEKTYKPSDESEEIKIIHLFYISNDKRYYQININSKDNFGDEISNLSIFLIKDQ